ncbi:MAG: molecular chaperone [Gammaproteobacteria bacterium]
MNIKSLIFILILVIPSLTNADMILNKSIIYFEPGQPNREDLEIQNAGADPLYIQVTPKIVHNPGSDDQSREIFDNPKSAGLLVSPNKLIVPPNGRKLLRFVNLNPKSTEEKVYRVSVTPVIGDLSAKKSGVKILIGYEVLVIVHPVQGDFNLTYERTNNNLIISNQGNQNVLLRKGTQCPAGIDDENLCEHYPGKRLYPGNTWSLDLTKDQPVTYFLSRGKEHSVRVFE